MTQNDSSKSTNSTNVASATVGPGSHPVGTGVGAAGGAVAGAALGTIVGGPVGTVVGGAVGAATGALAGQTAARIVNPTAEDTYWSEHYRTRPYFVETQPYSEFRPAFQYGWESRTRLGNRTFKEVEGDLARGWDKAKGESQLAWAQAKNATADAWDHAK
ncbi:MAG: hypothetical protein ACKVX7_13605 [Planctomycetota bacterium]